MPENMVISNASPIMNLAVICQLDLLMQFFSEIYIPQAVWREVVIEGEGKKGTENVKRANWIKVIEVENSPFLQLLKKDIDEGEAETIAYAIQIKAALVLLDEEEAREIADFYGLKKTGVIGILIRAKLMGKLPSLKEALDKLREKAGFWIKESLYQDVLEEVGEKA